MLLLLLTVAVGTDTCRAVIEVVVAVVIIVDPVLEQKGLGAGSLGVRDIKISPTCSL